MQARSLADAQRGQEEGKPDPYLSGYAAKDPLSLDGLKLVLTSRLVNPKTPGGAIASTARVYAELLGWVAGEGEAQDMTDVEIQDELLRLREKFCV